MSLKADFSLVVNDYLITGDELAEFTRLVRSHPEQARWVEREAQRIRGECTHPNAVGINERIKTALELKVKSKDG